MRDGSSSLTKKLGDFNLLAGNLPGPMREKESIFADCTIGITDHKSHKFLN